MDFENCVRAPAALVQEQPIVEESGGGGTLYFDEACQSYSREAGGRCSALVALNPFTKKLPLADGSTRVEQRLRRGPQVPRREAYGFTGEAASIRVVRRSDGKVINSHALAHTNFKIKMQGRQPVGGCTPRSAARTSAWPASRGRARLVALATTPPIRTTSPSRRSSALPHAALGPDAVTSVLTPQIALPGLRMPGGSKAALIRASARARPRRPSLPGSRA